MSRRTALFLPARPVRLAAVAAIGAALNLGVLVLPASADEEIVIRPETVIYDAPGSQHRVTEMPVPAELVGQPCDLRVTTQNQSSVHAGTVVTVTTGSSETVVTGVEDSPDGQLLTTNRVTLGSEIDVDVTIGPDGSSSLGFTVGFECTPESLLPVVEPAKQLAPPSTAAPVVAPAVTEPPTTAAPVTAAPTVLPAKVVRPAELPQAQPAKATTATPNFTG